MHRVSEEPPKPLFVRLPAEDADRLSAVAASTGRSKRQIVGDAVRHHLAGEGELQVGRLVLPEPAAEVLTTPEAAALLRVEEAVVVEAAERGELPARRLGDGWRFSRSALLAWLDHGG